MTTNMSSLVRAVDVTVDRSSWRAQPPEFRHPFPLVLGRQRGPFPVHVLAMLLRVGELTTPVLNIQSGVARLWPLLRYLHAVADTPGFRLRAGWADTDRHQKAIASDDLGVGLAMEVLYRAFDYSACIDGRAFLHRLNQIGLLAGDGGLPPKVGMMKMADYAAVDSGGKFHIIECKGSQGSVSALTAAMADGVFQKQSLICSSPAAERRLIGQRLVTGVSLVLEGAQRDTRVIITDPAPLVEGSAELIEAVSARALHEPALRLEVARTLGTAGAFRAATAMAETDRPADYPALNGPDQRGRIRSAVIDDEIGLSSFEAFGEAWIGESTVVPLLEPIVLADRVFRSAHLRKGVSRLLMEELRGGQGGGPLFQDLYPDATQRLAVNKVVAGETDAHLIRPGISISSIELIERKAG